MKKKILVIAGCLSICAVAALGVNVVSKAKASSNLLMANIEALTDVELESGTCAWGERESINGQVVIWAAICNISKESAQELAAEGGNWCCDSCGSTWYWDECDD